MYVYINTHIYTHKSHTLVKYFFLPLKLCISNSFFQRAREFGREKEKPNMFNKRKVEMSRGANLQETTI